MKAAVLLESGKLICRETPTPECPPKGVLVEIQACGICSADVKMVTNGHRALTYPRILGHEIAGVVVETKNRRWKPGDRVQVAPGFRCEACRQCRRGADNQCEQREILGFTQNGGFAEYIAVPLDAPLIGALTPLPEHVQYKDATLGEPIACCINAQEKTVTGPGDAVVIIGAGPLGILHSFVAKARGAETVILCEIQEHRRTGTAKIWADRIVDPLNESILQTVMEETNGKGADILIFSCSQASLDDELIDMMAPCGRISIFSGTPPSISQIRLDSNTVHYKEISISGAYGCTARQNTEAIRLMASNMWLSYKFATRSVTLETIEQGIEDTKTNRALKSILEVTNGK